MGETKDRRREERLSYQLPVWFGERTSETTLQGQMVDICSSGMAFSCSAGEKCPRPGQQLTTRFSLPRPEQRDPSAMISFTRAGRVCRVDEISSDMRRVAIQFDAPPPFWDVHPRC